MDKLTSQEDWKRYWSKKSIGRRFVFPFKSAIHPEVYSKSDISILEIGGFPGNMSVSLSKEFENAKVSILDYFVLPQKVREVENEFGLSQDSIKVFESDFFDHNLKQKFEIVCSFGFVEHFEDTLDLINRHLDLCKPGGTVLITVPNFRGLNGLFQRLFDPEVFNTHNVDMMDISFIQSVLSKVSAEKKDVFYFGRPNVWIEANSSYLLKTFVKFIGKLLWAFKWSKGKLFSPHICIVIEQSEKA